MNCQNCGAAIQPGMRRCVKCGSQVEQVSQPGYVPQQPGYLPPQAPVGPPKSRLAAGLLGIFLGGLGVHRFYLGYTSIGAAQLVLSLVVSWFTCGISAMVAGAWGLIEGILILVGAINRDAQGRPLA